VFLLVALPAQAFTPFTVKTIRMEGLQRITEGTVLNYLPISPGEQVDNRRAQQAVRQLYETEFFNDVRLLRDGGVLIVRIKERATISSFDIEGNKQLGGDELKDVLAKSGLAENQPYKPGLLDQIQQELRAQYYANGRYGVEIETEVINEPNNRVRINIEVDEGDTAEIRRINIVGNEAFSDKELMEDFTLEPSSLLTLIGSADQYSQLKLSGDLETLTAFYHNRGYIDFQVTSVQVSLSPDREDVYITVNVSEGQQFNVGKFEFAGELLVPEAELRQLIVQQTGSIFSRGIARIESQNIRNRLANDGYAFAEVNFEPNIDRTQKTVDITFRVEPGKRVYVRRINFFGNVKTDDEVLRREMRLLEGGLFSTTKLQRSQERLARLPFVQDLKVDTQPVAGTDDQVDISLSIVERTPGSVQLGVGFSDSQGFLVNGSVTHANFRGTGARLSVDANRSEQTNLYRVSYSEPYYTLDGIGRNMSAFYRKTEGISTNIDSDYTTDVLGLSLGYSFPLSENDSWSLGVNYRSTAMQVFTGRSQEIDEFTIDNGTEFDTYTLRLGWTRDTLNRAFFPTRGLRHRLSFDFVTPLSDLEYYQATYDLLAHIPIWNDWVLAIDANVGYTDTYGDTSEVPPYERYFAGGPTSIRGFRAASLGPLDSNRDPFGGLVRVVTRSELLLPLPLQSTNQSTRLTWFVDAGNTFDSVDDVSVDDFRVSTGVSFYWLTPILGLLTFSYGYPLNEQPGDRTDRFQFTFGTGF